MKYLFITILLYVCGLLSAQTNFEKGYYINLNGIKTEGYIKNTDWKNSPNSIDFKSNLEENSIEINASQISEFEIENKLKFKRFNVDIEKSSVKSGQLTNNSKTPHFKSEDVLLKVIIEGKASLYHFYENGIEKFFYSTDKINIEQLVFLAYLADEEDYNANKKEGLDNIIPNSTILYNRIYRKQLNLNVNCNNSRDDISKLEYSKSTLSNFFEKYNECENASFKKFENGNKPIFKLKASLINNFHSANLTKYGSADYSANFGSLYGIGFGFEAELILPFNNNKWSIIIEPSYNSYKKSKKLYAKFSPSLDEQEVELKYNYIQIPIGLRHYFYLNNNFSIFINGLYNVKINNGTNGVKYSFSTSANMDVFSNLNNLAFGIGFNYKKYSIESRLFSNTQILEKANQENKADYKNFSLNLRYQFL